MQHLDLSDDETVALAQELHAIVENDRYPLSPRVDAQLLGELAVDVDLHDPTGALLVAGDIGQLRQCLQSP
jgi:hypothetical protein